MRRRSYIALIFFGCVILALILFSMKGDSENGAPRDAPGASGERAMEQTLQGLTVEGVDARGGHWTLNAEGVAADTQGSLARMEDVRLQINGSDGGPGVEALAATSMVEADKWVDLSGGVKINWDKWSAALLRARYDSDKGLVTSEEEVELFGEGLKIKVRGRGLIVDVEAHSAKILSEVHAVIGGVGK